MCTILFSWKNHPEFPLVLLANRDEFYERATRTAHWWEDHPDVLGGRDLKAGGTWMGVNKNGRFAAVTNYRKFPFDRTYETSRGDLVKDFLTGDMPAPDYLEWLQKHGQEYEGFNLLFGNPDELYYYGNRGSGKKLEPGIYTLSNALLDTPWFKTERGKRLFEENLETGLQNHEVFFNVLKDEVKAPENQLPDTGIGLERERLVSSIFIKSENYGTRLSTVFTIQKDGKVKFKEKSFIPLKKEPSLFEFLIS